MFLQQQQILPGPLHLLLTHFSHNIGTGFNWSHFGRTLLCYFFNVGTKKVELFFPTFQILAQKKVEPYFATFQILAQKSRTLLCYLFNLGKKKKGGVGGFPPHKTWDRNIGSSRNGSGRKRIGKKVAVEMVAVEKE